MIKNIIFDWSGVIDDCTMETYLTVLKVFETYGAKQISLEEFRQEWEQPYMLFYNKYLPEVTLEQQRVIYIKNIQKFKRRAYPGMVNLLKKAKKKRLKMFVLSGDPIEKIKKDVENFGLEGIFSKFYDDIHDKIPVLKKLIKENQLKPQETIFIGDTTHEVEAGKIAGIKTACVTWGFQTREKLITAKPDFIVDGVEELKHILLLRSSQNN